MREPAAHSGVGGECRLHGPGHGIPMIPIADALRRHVSRPNSLQKHLCRTWDRQRDEERAVSHHRAENPDLCHEIPRNVSAEVTQFGVVAAEESRMRRHTGEDDRTWSEERADGAAQELSGILDVFENIHQQHQVESAVRNLCSACDTRRRILEFRRGVGGVPADDIAARVGVCNFGSEPAVAGADVDHPSSIRASVVGQELLEERSPYDLPRVAPSGGAPF